MLAHMRADDAADSISELPQDRRTAVLELLPPTVRTRILVLLGYNPSTAGGMMGVEYVSLQDDATAGEALEHLRAAVSAQSEALTTVYTVDSKGRMRGSVTCIELLRAEPTAALGDLADHQAICIAPETDLSDVALLMADYNLVAVPVVDEDDHLVGLVTVDDVLEAIIPEDWRRRNPNPRHEHPYSPEVEELPGDTA